jgi:hypothetical protein
MGSSFVAFAVVLLPGIAAWWTGRRLIPLRDNPALPERLMARRTRLAQAAGICWAGQLILPGGSLWMLAPGLLALLTGSFASRRALFGETWGLGPYLAWVLRLGVASVGFWTLLAAAPALVEWAGGSWLAMGVLTAVLLAWSVWFAAIFRATIGARPSPVRRCLRRHVDRVRRRHAAERPRDRTRGPGRRGNLRDASMAAAAPPAVPCSLWAASPMLLAATRRSCRRSACPADRPAA